MQQERCSRCNRMATRSVHYSAQDEYNQTVHSGEDFRCGYHRGTDEITGFWNGEDYTP